MKFKAARSGDPLSSLSSPHMPQIQKIQPVEDTKQYCSAQKKRATQPVITSIPATSILKPDDYSIITQTRVAADTIPSAAIAVIVQEAQINPNVPVDFSITFPLSFSVVVINQVHRSQGHFLTLRQQQNVYYYAYLRTMLASERVIQQVVLVKKFNQKPSFKAADGTAWSTSRMHLSFK